jgi:hypothetical protein
VKTTERMPCDDTPGLAVVDWAAAADDVLGAIDDQLAEHNLEIELFGGGGDVYAWRIVRRTPRTKAAQAA